jgi:hypothetical protein
MYIEELSKKLADVGVHVSRKTLRRWADQGLISNRKQRFPPRGRGNTENWPSEAFEEAAAVWAVKETAKKRLTPKEIKDIQIVGMRTFYNPQAYYTWSHDVPLTGPVPRDRFPRHLLHREGYDHRVLRIEFRDDHPVTLFSRLVELRTGEEPRPGEERLIEMLEDERTAAAIDYFIQCDDPVRQAPILVMADLTKLRVNVPSHLVRTWVMAFVKAACGVEVTAPKKVVFHWRTLHDDAGSFFVFEKTVLEEPDLRDPSYAHLRESIIAPKEPPLEDEVVICVDGVDVRKKVFYAPFDDWDPSKQYGPAT